MGRMKLSAECASTSLDDKDHLVITIDVLTEFLLASSGPPLHRLKSNEMPTTIHPRGRYW